MVNIHCVNLEGCPSVQVSAEQALWLKALLRNVEEWRFINEEAHGHLYRAGENNPATPLVEFRLTDQVNFLSSKGFDARLTGFGFRVALELTTPELHGHFIIESTI